MHDENNDVTKTTWETRAQEKASKEDREAMLPGKYVLYSKSLFVGMEIWDDWTGPTSSARPAGRTLAPSRCGTRKLLQAMKLFSC